MKVSELIKALQEYPQDIEVKIFDWRKNLNDMDEDGSSEGIYDFNVNMEVLSDDEKEYYKDFHDRDFKPFLELSFNSDDYSDEGAKYD